jgi:cellulose synthase/poly-beta-1,6-N-acetylglucosamine synthase-like glycosyltransferase
MKLIEVYGKTKKISFNPAMTVYTEAVTSYKDLIKQRYRWKYGRYQVFIKRKVLFWNKSDRYNHLLTWLYLPYALFAELTYSLEPLVILFLLYLLFTFHNYAILIGSLLTFCFYTIIQVTGHTQGYSKKERLKLALLAPAAYFLMYIISSVEYVATFKGLLNLRKLYQNYKNNVTSCDWIHVARPD